MYICNELNVVNIQISYVHKCNVRTALTSFAIPITANQQVFSPEALFSVLEEHLFRA